MANKLVNSFRKFFGAAAKPELETAKERIPDLQVSSGAELMAHMRRLDEIRTLFSDGTAHVGAADRYYSEDEEIDYLFDTVGESQRFNDALMSYPKSQYHSFSGTLMSHIKPWYHTILLSGETLTSSEPFYSAIVQRLRNGPVSPYASYQQTFDWLLKDLVSFLPGKNFFSPAFREHELYSLAPAAYSLKDIKATVGSAYLNGTTLEFGYSNEPKRPTGSGPETHYRRVKVKRLNGERSFQAWNHLGYRTFLFEKMRSAIVAPRANELTPDVLVVVKFNGAGEVSVQRLLLDNADADVRTKLKEARRGLV